MSSESGRSFSGKSLALWAVLLLVLGGLGLRQKSTLLQRGQSAVEASEGAALVQGAPIDSTPTKSRLPQKKAPDGANLELMSKSAPAPKAKDGYVSLTFELLSGYDFPLTANYAIAKLPDGSEPVIPENIKNLDGRKVSLSGYAMPLDTDGAESSHFILVKNQLLCCYGQEPKVNEYCIVIMDQPTKVIVDQPVTVSGTMGVGKTMEGDMLLGLYQIQGETVEPLEFP